jgi:uncharacterized membrane protein YkvA (DUF1232 family)
MIERARQWARSIEGDVATLYLAARDPRTPWPARAAALAVAAYAVSPIDLIPDVIPVLGYLDDLVILPLGIVLATRLIPRELLAELRQAAQTTGPPPSHWIVAAIIAALWAVSAVSAAVWIWHSCCV